VTGSAVTGVPAPNRAATTRPRLGFLGVGWIGRNRLDALREAGAADVAAFVDPAVALDGVARARSLDELLERDLDGIVIATPSALHAEQAEAALARGVPVFCQKPLGRNAAETARVVEAARAADLLLGVDLSYRFTAAAQRVRELVRSGELGEVYALDLVFHNAYGPDKSWFYDPELAGGGCLVDVGVHLVDLALWTLEPREARVLGARTHGEPVEDYAAATLALDGAAARLACSWRLHAGRDCVVDVAFYGTRGGARLANVGGSFYDFVAERLDGARVETLVRPPDAWGGRAAVDWARRLARRERFDPECERLVHVAELLDEVYACAS
jgi:predicted dehydrogenase